MSKTPGPHPQGRLRDAGRGASALLALLLLVPLAAVGSAQPAEDGPASVSLYFGPLRDRGVAPGVGLMEPVVPDKPTPDELEAGYELSRSKLDLFATVHQPFTLKGDVEVAMWVAHLDELVHTGDPNRPDTMGRPYFEFRLFNAEIQRGMGWGLIDDLDPGAEPRLVHARIVMSGTPPIENESLRLQVVHLGRPILTTDSSSPLRFLVNSTARDSRLTVEGVSAEAFLPPVPERTLPPKQAGPAPPTPAENDTPAAGDGPPAADGGIHSIIQYATITLVAALSGWFLSRLLRSRLG